MMLVGYTVSRTILETDATTGVTHAPGLDTVSRHIHPSRQNVQVHRAPNTHTQGATTVGTLPTAAREARPSEAPPLPPALLLPSVHRTLPPRPPVVHGLYRRVQRPCVPLVDRLASKLNRRRRRFMSSPTCVLPPPLFGGCGLSPLAVAATHAILLSPLPRTTATLATALLTPGQSQCCLAAAGDSLAA